MEIYILKHSSPKFSGTFFGVGFDNGRGSTSSKQDRDRCVNNGCKDITTKIESIKVLQKKKEEAKADKSKKPEKEEEEEEVKEPEKDKK